MASKTWANNARIWGEIKRVLQSNEKLVVYDLETTGLSKDKDRFIQIAAVRFKINEDLSLTYDDKYVHLVNPGFLISGEITDLTGITNLDLENQPKEEDLFDDIMEFFRDYPVAGYNIKTFDNHFMKNYYMRQLSEFQPAGVIDVIELARARLHKPDVKNHQLKTIGDFFGIEFKAHDALNDTMATAEILKILIRECVEDDEKPAVPTVKPTVMTVNFWEGHRGYSRIYVTTSAGTVYYDIRNSSWGNKDADIDKIDMGYVEEQAWKIAGCSSEAEFKRYKGKKAS